MSPWVALNLYSAFPRAKDLVRTDAQPWIDTRSEVGALDSGLRQVLSRDVMPYGVKAARHVLDTVTGYVYEQGLVSKQIQLEELFAPNTLAL